MAFTEQTSRLRVVNGCPSEPLWFSYEVGSPYGVCGTIADPDFLKVNPGAYHDYSIPDAGLCGFRLWPQARCGADGKKIGLSGDDMDCEIGPSGGIHSKPYCPGELVNKTGMGCSPPIDSKFEGSFGCTYDDEARCRTTPQGATLFNVSDYWDTSLVDGWTLPFKVKVLDPCTFGPPDGTIDCLNLSIDQCPTDENLSTTGTSFPQLENVSLHLKHPITR